VLSLKNDWQKWHVTFRVDDQAGNMLISVDAVVTTTTTATGSTTGSLNSTPLPRRDGISGNRRA
jgi:hypothetical protein